MKRRNFSSGPTRFWRDRFLQIARETDTAVAKKAPAHPVLGLRPRSAMAPVARLRARPSGLAAA
jgi:hypothetical protein